ncbi:septum site-determining protein MinC [Castellaniella sp.]|uniref:septum site-determining protein MinC n=1 Tax=Castellaniella sp. TaxID=1955812 RepID=UPI002AFEB50A|nr:septum site-determining protein MinC [Castellaniella sp.]
MASRSDVLDFKSATLYMVRAVLHTADTAALLQALEQRLQQAGAFYENEPVILDAQALGQAPDWAALAAALRRHHLHPIGVQAQAALLPSILQAGLAPLVASTGRTTGPSTVEPQPPASPPVPPETPAQADSGSDLPVSGHTLVIRHPLRSGQRIYAKGSDLIVMGLVSQGAEVIADGHIHVYGPLRGKAIAGAQGRTDAMIMTTQLDPELLAIAGVYRIIETRLPDTLHNHPAQVHLDGDTLRIREI